MTGSHEVRGSIPLNVYETSLLMPALLYRDYTGLSVWCPCTGSKLIQNVPTKPSIILLSRLIFLRLVGTFWELYHL
jgi:hypothetical protein